MNKEDKLLKNLNDYIENEPYNNRELSVQSEELIDGCKESLLIFDFFEDKLNADEKEPFYKHLCDCNECREFLALIKRSHSKFRSETEASLKWETLDNGLNQLRNFLKPFLTGLINLNQNQVNKPEVIFRGQKDTFEYQEISLPEDNGIVCLKLLPDTDTFNLEIKITNSKVFDNRIDIYVNNSILDSIDGNCLIFQVPRQEFRILINEKFEIH